MGCRVQCEFLRKGDLVGLIWESEDSFAHPAHARETSRDYSRLHAELPLAVERRASRSTRSTGRR